MRAATLATALIACLLAGCGSSASKPPAGRDLRAATLMLDFTPNAVHTGIYAALAQQYDRDEGIRLHVIAPTASTDPIKLLETGRVDFALLDIHDLAIARQRGADIMGVMAIVERPLAAVIAQPAVASPKQLAGRTVGITGVPSDTAVLRSVVAGAGGDPAKLRTITIGFNAVADLLAGRVAAATAFWNDEGVTVRSRRRGFHVFRVDDYGAPSYPELVLCATRTDLRREPGVVREVVRALARGYRFALQHPQASTRELERQVTGLEPSLVQAQLNALLPAFRATDGRVGELNLATLRAWARWEARFGIVSRPPDVAAAFDTSFVP
jgi:NitT/TauT family transport system substrate-binding protein/putative hydroxymethylpyrimidine transport system substrate-binding protein